MHIWGKFMDRKDVKMDKNNHQIAYMGKISGQKMQKTIKNIQKNAYIVENCAKLCKKRSTFRHKTHIQQKNGTKMTEKCIYSRKNDQKSAKKGQKKSQKRIYRDNFTHFLEN